MKCLVIDKTKYVQELYTQNDKQWEIKNLNKWRHSCAHRRLITVKMSSFLFILNILIQYSSSQNLRTMFLYEFTSWDSEKLSEKAKDLK